MSLKQLILVIALSAATAFGSVWAIDKFGKENDKIPTGQNAALPDNYKQAGEKTGITGNAPLNQIDFTKAAEAATPAVVHITTTIPGGTVAARRNPLADIFGDDFFGDVFGNQQPRQMPDGRASGSGVIVSADGYIVTNNHVIDNASEIKVTLSNKITYTAKLIGADPSYDLAVIKIDVKSMQLPYIAWGNSDNVKLGQWVLAIGYPLNLDVTVTAGIVSAKSRALGINAKASGNLAVESFIQTDAAVNQGNSGGALVDADGRLIGINSAIASPTGAYAGYSYAIPVNMVKKIVGDLTKYGTVQRAFIGLSYPNENITEEDMVKYGIKQGEGVFVLDVVGNGAAEKAGLKKGDYITGINGIPVSTGSQMIEQVSNYKPGDKITLNYKRNNKDYVANVTLQNRSGNYDLVTAATGESSLSDKLGGTFENLDRNTASRLGLSGGVKVVSVGNGLLKNSRVQEDFIITSVDGRKVNSVDDLAAIINGSRGVVKLEGIFPGFEGYYAFPLNLSGSSNQRNQ